MNEKGIFIIGAGFAGQMIAKEIKQKKIFGKVIAFLDVFGGSGSNMSQVCQKRNDLPSYFDAITYIVGSIVRNFETGDLEIFELEGSLLFYVSYTS